MRLHHAMVRIRGSYALAMMFRDYPEEIYVARKDSPMILGVAEWRILYRIGCTGDPEVYQEMYIISAIWRWHV